MDAPELFVRRIDGQLVEAIRFTGENVDEVATWAGPGFLVEDVPVWAWVIRDDKRVYVVKGHAFTGHARQRLIE